MTVKTWLCVVWCEYDWFPHRLVRVPLCSSQRQGEVPCASHCFPILDIFIDESSSYHLHKILSTCFFFIGRRCEACAVFKTVCPFDKHDHFDLMSSLLRKKILEHTTHKPLLIQAPEKCRKKSYHIYMHMPKLSKGDIKFILYIFLMVLVMSCVRTFLSIFAELYIYIYILIWWISAKCFADFLNANPGFNLQVRSFDAEVDRSGRVREVWTIQGISYYQLKSGR